MLNRIYLTSNLNWSQSSVYFFKLLELKTSDNEKCDLVVSKFFKKYDILFLDGYWIILLHPKKVFKCYINQCVNGKIICLKSFHIHFSLSRATLCLVVWVLFRSDATHGIVNIVRSPSNPKHLVSILLSNGYFKFNDQKERGFQDY